MRTCKGAFGVCAWECRARKTSRTPMCYKRRIAINSPCFKHRYSIILATFGSASGSSGSSGPANMLRVSGKKRVATRTREVADCSNLGTRDTGPQQQEPCSMHLWWQHMLLCRQSRDAHEWEGWRRVLRRPGAQTGGRVSTLTSTHEAGSHH